MRPTPTGWSALSAGVCLYAAGVALGYPELVAGGAALLLLVVAAFGWVVRPPHLEVNRHVEPARVRRQDAALGLVQVTNTGRHRSPRLLVEDRAGTATVTIEVPPLPGRAAGERGGTHQATYRVPTGRRGRYQMGPLVLSQSDPFGLVARRRAVGEPVPLWVHPRSYPVPAAPAGASLEVDGPMDDTAPEGSIAFQGLRPYVVGDDLRLVHWRTTARTGTLMVKKHVDTSRPQVAVLLDDRVGSYPDPDWFEEAVDVAASLVEQAMRAGAPVRIDQLAGAGVQGQVRAPYVPLGVTDALDHLAGIPAAEGPGSLDTTVAALEGELGGSAALLVSGARLTDSVTALDRLAARYRRVSALLVGAEASGARRVGRLEVCRAGPAVDVLRVWRGSG